MFAAHHTDLVRLGRYFLSVMLSQALLLANACIAARVYAGPVSVVDDRGRTVSLAAPAKRIVSLAPHTSEMLFSAGAGDRVVGVVSYSDYPEAAKHIPKVGSYAAFDYEQILALKPDLVVGWGSGNPNEKIERLKTLGFTVYLTEPKDFESIASNVERLATLAGTRDESEQNIAGFRERYTQLKARYQALAPVSLFYEIWHEPMMTLNGDHLFNEVVESCGARNIFADLKAIAPHVSREDVLLKDPEIILASGMGEARPDWLDEWKKWPNMQAVANEHLYFIHPDILQRHTFRIVEGTEQLCAYVHEVRQRRAGGN